MPPSPPAKKTHSAKKKDFFIPPKYNSFPPKLSPNFEFSK
jgi:hypothetical protein